MHKIPDCDRCLFCAYDPHIVCAIHPSGPHSRNCIDFRPDPDLEGKRFVDFLGLEYQQRDNEPYSNSYDLEPNRELWEPAGASYYNGELVIQPQQRWTTEEQLELLDWHPMFTGKCPRYGALFDRDYTARVHYDCPVCGWMDDTV